MGATATGKSRLAISLAEAFDGEIVSRDSRQAYRGLDVGTGKESRAEREGADLYTGAAQGAVLHNRVPPLRGSVVALRGGNAWFGRRAPALTS